MKHLFAVLILLVSIASQAAVVINSTRVIYQEDEGEAIVQLRNHGGGPVLAQAWIDDGDMLARPETIDVPFTLTPSIARIDAGKGQAIRILRIRDNLPADRESLLWFNVMEVPPAPTQKIAQGDNLIQFSIRSRIKLFYRPKALRMQQERAQEQLQFALEAGKAGSQHIRVSNPTPYYVTFRTIKLRRSPDAPALAEVGQTAERMVAPGGSLTLPLKVAEGHGPLPEDVQVFFSVVNDYGGETSGQRGVSHEKP